jgi:hypothetical protein
VESDSKKESMLEELKVATRDQREKIERDRDALAKDKDAFDL